jgi:hypothetical protein
MKKYIILGALIMSLLSCFQSKTKEEKFWIWFEENSDTLFHFENNQEVIFNQLSKQLQKVNPDLTFEFGPIQNEKREFIISAGGIKSAFPAVENLYSVHPNSDKWVFIKFRPRRETLMSLKFNDLEIQPSELKYMFFKDENPQKIGLLLLIKNFDDTQYNLYAQIGYLFLDQIIGEYDVETYLGAIEIQGFDSEYYSKANDIDLMAKELDSWKPHGTSSNSE